MISFVISLANCLLDRQSPTKMSKIAFEKYYMADILNDWLYVHVSAAAIDAMETAIVSWRAFLVRFCFRKKKNEISLLGQIKIVLHAYGIEIYDLYIMIC